MHIKDFLKKAKIKIGDTFFGTDLFNIEFRAFDNKLLFKNIAKTNNLIVLKNYKLVNENRVQISISNLENYVEILDVEYIEDEIFSKDLHNIQQLFFKDMVEKLNSLNQQSNKETLDKLLSTSNNLLKEYNAKVSQ